MIARRIFVAEERTDRGVPMHPPRAHLVHPPRAGRVAVRDETIASRGSVLILVVESDPYLRSLQQALLGEAYSVHFVTDGAAALEAAHTLHPRLLIADILVPRIDGLRVCRTLKAEPSTRAIRVLIFSELLAERRAREAGADAFLHKPIDEQRFLDEVRRLLEGGNDG